MATDMETLRSFALFANLDPAVLERLTRRAVRRRVAAGDAVFRQGETAASFFLLVSGRLKVTQVTEDGQQIVVRVVYPGDLFGFTRALGRPDYPGTSHAVVDAEVIGWATQEWELVVNSNPRLAVNAMQTIGQRLDEAHTRLRGMSTQDVERRVAHAVLRLIRNAGTADGDGTRIDFPISRQDIAEMTGTTLHTVSRILSAWEGMGLVRGGRQRLTVIDPEGLRDIARP